MKIEPEQLIKIEDVVSVADHQDLVQLSESSTQIIQESRQRLVSIQNRGEPVYGINTGYGIFANKSINQADIQHLNRKLILSHAVGIGDPLPDRVVMAAMFIRVNTLSKGYSGVRPELIQTIIDMLNNGVTPVIPSKGSLSSSGDSHCTNRTYLLFLALTTFSKMSSSPGATGEPLNNSASCKSSRSSPACRLRMVSSA